MADDDSLRFARWRDTGDPTSLAEVFDATAPELLQLALHLSRNTSDAEDLLQGTFLMAIQSAERFDVSRPLLPWLTSILTHRAQADRRRTQRQASTLSPEELDSLRGRGSDPAQSAVSAELTQSVLVELDALPEPYRQPTVLRIRHGLLPVDIAHVLKRSPSTVRVQIHRGLELLRKALPAGVAGVLVTGLAASRGLAAIRSAVLSEAHALSSASLALFTLGGVLVTQKIISVAVAVIILVGLVLVMNLDLWPSASIAPEARSVVTDVKRGVSDENSKLVAPSAMETAETRRPLAVGSSPIALATSLRILVIDGPSKEPIEAATVALHGPTKLTLDELKRRYYDHVEQLGSGSIYSSLEYLRFPRVLPPEVVFGRQPMDVFVPPAEGRRALAERTTGRDGRCELRIAESGAMLVVSSEGRRSRFVGVLKGDKDELTVKLWPMRRLRGRIVTAPGELLPRRLLLRFRDASKSSSGEWDTWTNEAGEFDLRVPAGFVRVLCLTPGWAVARRGVHPETKKPWSFKISLRAGEEDGLIYVRRFGVAHLHVTDAVTGDPVESIRLLSRDRHRLPRHSGRFLARDGLFDVTPWRPLQWDEGIPDGPARLDLVVWSEGYDSSSVTIGPLYGEGAGVVEVVLQRGGVKSLRGFLRKSAQPVNGAPVHLRVVSAGNWEWRKDLVIDSVLSGNDGAFTLTAPAGRYLLETTNADLQLRKLVTLPSAEPLHLDFAAVTSVTIVVVDAQGLPLADHYVSVRGEGGESKSGSTDEDGRCRLGPFSAGSYRAATSLTAGYGSWSADLIEKLKLKQGEQREVRFVVPDHLLTDVLLEFEGDPSPFGFDGFRVREQCVKDQMVAVGPDGMARLQLRPGDRWVEVLAPDQRRWRCHVPAGSGSTHTITIRWSGLAYAGVLKETDGSPIRRARVYASPVTGDGPYLSTVTDEEGRFRILGLDASRPWGLGFHEKSDSPFREFGGSELAMSMFYPKEPPSDSPALLNISLPRFRKGAFVGEDSLVITGQVTDRVGGKRVANAIVSVTAISPQSDGELHSFPLSGWQHSDDEGRYRIVVRPVARYRADFYLAGRPERGKLEWGVDDVAFKLALERDLILP